MEQRRETENGGEGDTEQRGREGLGGEWKKKKKDIREIIIELKIKMRNKSAERK